MYMIILNHALTNPKVATKREPSFKGSTVDVEKPLIFKAIEEAKIQIQIESFQCAAIVKIVDTYSD